ncbi:hypothetical protein VP01_345g3 [Puccinia sorghi]|uniref:Cytochrome P450 n=1 Tax=Puccinia sorghi TaxID=27349 RepID=A0A0L6UW79_9BASI|nr:hypothetical protein VP01_345g3 [Puccinia sorghi]
MLNSPVLHSLIVSGVAYLAYLLFEYSLTDALRHLPPGHRQTQLSSTPIIAVTEVVLLFGKRLFPHLAIGTTKRKDPLYKEVPGWPLYIHLIYLVLDLYPQLPESILDMSRPWEADTIANLQLRPGFSITLPGARVIELLIYSCFRILEITLQPILRTTSRCSYSRFHYNDRKFPGSRADPPFHRAICFNPLWRTYLETVSWSQMVRHLTDSAATVVEPTIDQTMEGVLQVIHVASEQGRDLDFCKLFNRFILDLFVEMTFGKKLGLPEGINNSVNIGHSDSEVFSDAFDFSQIHMDSRFHVAGVWQWIQKMNIRATHKMEFSCRTIHDLAYTAIDEKLSNFSNKGDLTTDETFENDFLGLIMASHLQKGHALTRDELRDDSLSFLFAGRDATAQSLSWCFFHLLMNKDITSRIREEAMEILGEDADHQGRVTPENYRQFTTAYAALLEAIRLHPAVPKNVKFAMTDDKIPGGPTIEAGDCLTWSDWLLARDPEVWGQDCGEFLPDRWIDETRNITHFGNFKFHSFNGGPRLCVGMNMSIYIGVKTIVEMLQNFDLEFSKGWLESVPMSEEIQGIKTSYPTPQYRPSLTLPMKNPMMISAKPRTLGGKGHSKWIA